MHKITDAQNGLRNVINEVNGLLAKNPTGGERQQLEYLLSEVSKMLDWTEKYVREDRSLSGIVRRARAGDANEKDASAAAEMLAATPNAEDRYDLLFVIGESNAVEHRDLVEGFLESSDDPMLARLALQILCDWGPVEPYRSTLLRFINGVAWDLEDGGYVRLVATSAAGEYLRGHRDAEVYRVLLDLYADQQASHLARGQAYVALARALGRSWNEIPRAHRDDWSLSVDPALLAEARQRAADLP